MSSSVRAASSAHSRPRGRRRSLALDRYVWAAAIVLGLIVYGSLYPFDFRWDRAGDPLIYLLAHWRTPSQTPAGFVANIVLYLPLGLCLGLIRANRRSTGRALLSAGAISLGLCMTMELVQFYDWGRRTTLTDVYLNVAGGLLGGLIATRLPERLARPVGDLRQPALWLLATAFAVIELYPFFPTLKPGWYVDALSTLWRHPQIEPLTFAGATLRWLVAAALLAQFFGRRRSQALLIALMAVVFCGQIVMLNIWLHLSEWSGAVLAAVLWTVLAGRRREQCATWLAGGLALWLVAGALLPWHWQANLPTLAGWSWIGWPDAQHPVRHLIERFYYIGALVWLAGVAGLGALRAGLIGAAGLIGLAALQTQLDGHAPGLGDALLALAAGGLFVALPPRDEPR